MEVTNFMNIIITIAFLGVSFLIWQFSWLGILITHRIAYLPAIFLSSTAIVVCIYYLLAEQTGERRKNRNNHYHYYFIDNATPDDPLYDHLKWRI